VALVAAVDPDTVAENEANMASDADFGVQDWVGPDADGDW
jgi:hypothetical protein